MFSATLWLLFFATTRTIAQQTPQPLSPAQVTDQRIHFFQSQLARDPDYYANYNRLASAYVQKARESGDIGYYELAERALKKSLELESQHPEAASAFAQLGSVQFAEHRFAEAATSAERALKLEDVASARALAGDAQLEMGNYAAAEAMFTRLAVGSGRSHPGREYLSTTRRASLAWMRGQVGEALDLMRQAGLLAEKAHLPAENLAWTHFMLGEQLFQSGNLAEAEAEMKVSLSAYPSYHRALGGLAQIRGAQHRFEEAAEFYRRAIAIVPLPIYASALGDIYRRGGKSAEAEKQYALVEYIGQLGALNQQVYNRELALFYADHDRRLTDALTLAQKELEARHDVYTWDALAWALCKTERTREAHEAIEKALALGTRDAMLFFHAAAIERQLGNAELSSEYARKSLAMNPEFHIFYADQARQWLASSRPTGVAERGARAN